MCFPGEVSPVCGARDEQVRREGDYGEEEGGRSKFQEDCPLDLLIVFMTSWWQIIHVCSGDNGGTNSCLFGNWWFASFYLFSAKRQPEIFIHWNDYRISSLGPKLKLFRDPLLQPMLAPCCRSCSVSTSQVLANLISNACFGMMDVIQGGPGHPALPDGTPCKWKSPGILWWKWTMKENTLASSVHGNGQLYLHFAPKGPWSQRLHKGAQDIWRESNNKLSMTWNADSQWCQRAGGSHGSHLAEGRPLWNDDARFGEDLERRFKKKTRPRKHIIALSREVCVGHLEHGCKDLQHLAAGIWRRDPSCWCQVSQKFPLFRKVWLPLVLTPTLSCGTQTRLGSPF